MGTPRGQGRRKLAHDAWLLRPVCPAVKASGEPCKMRCLAGKTTCFAHDPELNARRLEHTAATVASKRVFAIERFVNVTPSKLDIAPAMVRALIDVHRRRISPQMGTAIAALGSAAVRAWASTDLERRIAQLEAMRPSDVEVIVSPVWSEGDAEGEEQDA